MSGKPTVPTEKIREQVDRSRSNFIRTDLALCSTLASLAVTIFQLGKRESAEQAIASAEKGYETLSRFLSDPKHARHLTADEIKTFRAEVKELREQLDRLQSQPHHP